jgi:hypothetical protein
MKLDYALSLNSVTTLGHQSWSPARLFAQGQSGAFFSAQRGLFLDTGGTQPAQTPGQPIALMRDQSGNGNHALQPSVSQRPILGRHPKRGLANIYPANTTNMPGGSGWLSFRLSQTPALVSATGQPATHLTATESNANGAALLGGAREYPAGTYTLSAVVKADGWFMLRPTVESNFADGVQAWFNLTTGTVGQVVLGSGASVMAAPSATIVPIGDSYRVTLTFTTTAAAIATMRFYLVNGPTSLQVTAGTTARVEAPQLETGNVATGYQRRVSQYDITELGQQSVWFLSADGVDDWMQLAQPFTGGGPFAIAAVRDWHTGWPAPITFGSINGASFLNLAHGINLTTDGSANRLSFGAISGWPVVPAGRNRVDIVQIFSAAQTQAWRNDIAYSEPPEIVGDVTQVNGIDTLFRAGSGYGLGRFYGGVIASGVLSHTTRSRLHRHLAHLGGIEA